MPSEDWDTESGLMSDYEGTVLDAYWSKNNNGVLYLGLKLATDNPDRPETEERFGTGNEGGWDSFDGGLTAESKKVRKFNENCAMGKLINKARHLLGDERVEAVLGDSPRKANIWIGTKWFFEDEPISFKDRENPDGPKIIFHQNYPTKFLGKDEEITTPSTTSESETGTGVQSNGAMGEVDLSALGDDQAQVAQWAKELPHNEFSNKMLELLMEKGLLGQPAGDMIIKATANESGLYSQLKEG